MSKGRRAYPQKKKHSNKKRSAQVVPLTDLQRSHKASEEFQIALMHLKEAELLAKFGETPNACVHAAYFAMHHCAAAALLASGGVGKAKDYPRSHEHVIQHYGTLVSKEAGYLGASGQALNEARGNRVVSDYGLSHGAEQIDASELAIEARKFVEACDAKWALRSIVDSHRKPQV